MSAPHVPNIVYQSLWRGEILVKLCSMHQIVEDVALRNRVTVEAIRGRSRRRSISRPRQEAMWLIRQVRFPDGTPKFSYPQIGMFLGDRDHSTVIHGVRAFAKRLKAEASAEVA